MLKKKWLGVAASVLIAGALVAGKAGFKLLLRHRQASALLDAPSSVRRPRANAIAIMAYDGKLGEGWADWGWGPHQLPSSGPAKLQFTGYGGIIFHHELLSQRLGGVSFRYKAPGDWPEFLAVGLKSSQKPDSEMPSVPVTAADIVAAADGWNEVWLGMDELNPLGVPFDRAVISARASVSADWVLLDKVAFTKPGGVASESAAPAREIELAVRCASPSHVISPLIYGSAQGDWDSGQSAQRIGGNPTSRANWDIGAWNIANDWFFENTKSADNGAVIDDGSSHGAGTAVTVPTIGWVAKDSAAVGFPASRFRGQRKYDPNKPEAGDGYAPDGSPITPGPPGLTSIPAPPELIGSWIGKLRERDRARSTRGVLMYILDNEPSLWSKTHRDVHPEPLSYDESLDRTLRYATAIRAADPDTPIAGPAEWGWLGYMYSARDMVSGKFLRPDRRSHGDMPFIAWYLQKIAEHEKKTGIRILDVLDVHYYPAAENMFGDSGRTDPEGDALRIRSTRSLWDPDYKDESWVDENIRLIPRLKEWVRDYHPGLRISIGEWNFGGERDISGALATAEALGRFGQQGLDSAFFWGGPKDGTTPFWAFRAFRNFDGHGGRFQDNSLQTREDERVSLFASRNAAKTQVVAIAINRDPKLAATAHVRLEGCGALQLVHAYAYERGSSGLLEAHTGAPSDASFEATIPPYSVMVFDLGVDSQQAR